MTRHSNSPASKPRMPASSRRFVGTLPELISHLRELGVEDLRRTRLSAFDQRIDSLGVIVRCDQASGTIAVRGDRTLSPLIAAIVTHPVLIRRLPLDCQSPSSRVRSLDPLLKALGLDATVVIDGKEVLIKITGHDVVVHGRRTTDEVRVIGQGRLARFLALLLNASPVH